jgi:5-bromo-4-chloroindolyl phosphate hydrolysis protein
MNTRFNRLLEDIRDDLHEANTPEQIVEMLKKKIEGAQKLYDALQASPYTTYNISDFFKSDMPAARKLSDRITKQKKQLESSVSGFIRQAKKDLAAAEKAAKG